MMSAFLLLGIEQMWGLIEISQLYKFQMLDFLKVSFGKITWSIKKDRAWVKKEINKKFKLKNAVILVVKKLM